MADAARNYHKELLANEKAPATSSVNQEVDLDELIDKEAEKREALKRKGHGEYRDVTEGNFLGEVTSTEKAIYHFYHREFYRCKIMNKHLKTHASKHVDTNFIRLDAENAPFFFTKLGVKTLPCVIIFRKGVVTNRFIGEIKFGYKDSKVGYKDSKVSS